MSTTATRIRAGAAAPVSASGQSHYPAEWRIPS